MIRGAPAPPGFDAVPLPPVDIHQRRLQQRQGKNLQLMTVVRRGRPPLNFRATGFNRFDASDLSFATLYAAETLAVCFVETLLRGDEKQEPLVGGRTLLPESELRDRDVVVFDMASGKLAKFYGQFLKNLGGDATVCSVRIYDVPQTWSLALHAHPQKVDGFAYMSRHMNTKQAVVLFERVKSRLKVLDRSPLLKHPNLPKVLDTFQIAI